MATTGSVDVNLTSIGQTVNSGTSLASNVIGGVADQGSLIGTAIGLTLAIGLLFGLIFLIIKFVPKLIGSVKGYRGG